MVRDGIEKHLEGLFFCHSDRVTCHLDCLFDESPRTHNEDVVTRVLHLITIKN